LRRATSGWRGLPQVEPRCRNATSCLEIPPIRPTEGWLHSIQKITSCRLSWTAPWLGSTAAGAAKPAARLVFGLYPTPVLGDPRLSVGFGGEWADLGWMGFRDTDLHSEGPAVRGDHPIDRLGVRVAPLCHRLDLSVTYGQRTNGRSPRSRASHLALRRCCRADFLLGFRHYVADAFDRAGIKLLGLLVGDHSRFYEALG